jgi:hypothetical protein
VGILDRFNVRLIQVNFSFLDQFLADFGVYFAYGSSDITQPKFHSISQRGATCGVFTGWRTPMAGIRGTYPAHHAI